MSVLRTEEIRNQKKLSVSKLSDLSGVARGYITELEEGKYDNPGVQIVCKLCVALDVTPNELIDESLWKRRD